MNGPAPTPRPQNQSCPAGGAIAGDAAQRGVIVAPPSGNTDHGNGGQMRILHQGFDRLEVAIEANVTHKTADLMQAAKDQAEEAGHAVPFTHGGADLDIQPHGGGGYRYLLRGGTLDASFAIKKPNPRDAWGIRVMIGSELLATQGLGHARAYIAKTLARLGVQFGAHQVSIGRADYCVDVLAPGFELIPDRFVMHSHASRADHMEHMRSHGKSGRYSSVTVGKNPGRQVIIYDKRAEVIAKRKPIWWDIWNANLAREGALLLDPQDRSAQVWRIEVRAGKACLKDRWAIRQWAEFDALFGDVVAEALDKVRYCSPARGDANRARWGLDPIWALVRDAMGDDLLDMRSHVDPDHVRYVERDAHTRLIFAQLLGLATTHAALEGVTAQGLPAHASGLGAALREAVESAPEPTAKRLDDAKARYRFLSPL